MVKFKFFMYVTTHHLKQQLLPLLLSKVVVSRGVVRVPRQVVSLYERLDALLEVAGLRGESQLLQELADQRSVGKALAGLHCTYYRCIHLHSV